MGRKKIIREFVVRHNLRDDFYEVVEVRRLEGDDNVIEHKVGVHHTEHEAQTQKALVERRRLFWSVAWLSHSHKPYRIYLHNDHAITMEAAYKTYSWFRKAIFNHQERNEIINDDYAG